VRMGAGGAGWTVWRLAAGSSLLPLPVTVDCTSKKPTCKKGTGRTMRCGWRWCIFYKSCRVGRMSCTESYRYACPVCPVCVPAPPGAFLPVRYALSWRTSFERPWVRRATGPSDVVLFAKTATRQPFRFTSAVDAVLLCPTLTIVHGRSLT
jgi:hypothetical protein